MYIAIAMVASLSCAVLLYTVCEGVYMASGLGTPIAYIHIIICKYLSACAYNTVMVWPVYVVKKSYKDVTFGLPYTNRACSVLYG